MKKWICLILLILSTAVLAEQNDTAQVLTKGEAIQLLSATDFVKQKVGQLLSWTIGYDISKVNKVKLTPTINYIKALPRKVPPDGRTVVDIVASVDDPGGLGNISGVRADLSSIGRLANMVLVDNGKFGDEEAGDGIFTLQTSVPSRIIKGSKEIPVAVANKKGWLALGKTNLDISKNPVIIEAKLTPEEAIANGVAVVTLTATILNPGRREDLEVVSANLSKMGINQPIILNDMGKGGDSTDGDSIYSAEFVVPNFVAAGEYPIIITAKNVAGGRAHYRTFLRIYR